MAIVKLGTRVQNTSGKARSRQSWIDFFIIAAPERGHSEFNHVHLKPAAAVAASGLPDSLGGRAQYPASQQLPRWGYPNTLVLMRVILYATRHGYWRFRLAC